MPFALADIVAGRGARVMGEMWNSVWVYGPQSEIDRLRAWCVVTGLPEDQDGRTLAIDFDSIIPIPDEIEDEDAWTFVAWGVCGDPWNVRERKHLDRGTYWIAFDTAWAFPIPAFRRVAELFPNLAFDCDCIADDDSSMGFGWFNGPPGGEHFRDDYSVPKNYWTPARGYKRGPKAEMRHRARVDAMRCSSKEL